MYDVTKLDLVSLKELQEAIDKELKVRAETEWKCLVKEFLDSYATLTKKFPHTVAMVDFLDEDGYHHDIDLMEMLYPVKVEDFDKI